MSIPGTILFTPCCGEGQSVEYQIGGLPLGPGDPIPGVYNSGISTYDELGNPVLIEGQCYVLTQGVSQTPWSAPFWPSGTLTFVTAGQDCPENDPLCPCKSPQNLMYNAYSIRSCCGGPIIAIYTINTEIQTGINLYTGPSLIPNINPGCYTVESLPYTGLGVPPYTLVSNADFELQDPDSTCTSEICAAYCEPCTCVQLENIGDTLITVRYYDCTFTNTFIQLAPGEKSEKFCYTSWVTFPPTASAEYFGSCTIDPETHEGTCPGCFLLVDCAGVADSIYSLDPALAQYAGTGQSIMITGSNVCWQVIETTENCECAVSTTISYVYYDCKACKERKGYKLTECTTGAIIYTSSNLSQFEFTYVTIDCPGCWYVEPIDFVPPTDQPVTITMGFETCELCNATYYKLTDCSGFKDDIITIQDLSAYIGSIVKIKFCPETCWEVEEIPPTPITGEVFIDETYVSCLECILTIPSKCVTFTNTSDYPTGFDYIDYLGNVNKTNIQAKGSIQKVCAIGWNINESITVTEFGTCINGECPTVPKPKRKVTPGYNTPTCNPEYYEKVECNFSEWMYKDVLERRYGISNCCPDELMKWEIRHEMLMLDALINPDYICVPPVNCGCPEPINCSGSCNCTN